MIKKLFQKLLQASGKNYTVDSTIPNRLFVSILIKRLVMTCRGYIFLFQKVFLGKNCSITNKGNIRFGKNSTIENNTTIDGYAKNNLIFGDNCKIGAYSTVTCTSHLSKHGLGLQIGHNSAFGRFTEFGAAGGITIGNDVIGGSYISFHSENHVFSDMFKLIRNQGVTSVGIVIGNNVWIGAKVTFLDGCVVGNNCVVAAGAVVNSVFPDNVVIGGVPAKIIKERL